MRENLFKKYGVYDKEKDMLACKTLFEIYEQTKLNNNIFPVYKTLPLAGNTDNERQNNSIRNEPAGFSYHPMTSNAEAKIDN